MGVNADTGRAYACMSVRSVLHDWLCRSHSGRRRRAFTLYHDYSVNEMYARSVLKIREDKEPCSSSFKVLICGAQSYIGMNIMKYLQGHAGYEVHEMDMRGLGPEPSHFKGYDIVIYVAGIAHRRETARNAHLFFDVNYRLAVKAARAAQKAFVKQFILLSSMSVYGMLEGHITKETKTAPESCYGKSKLAADERIWELRNRDFRVAVLRPPVVYGKGCKGNYRMLRRAALFLPVFPDSGNRRSMVYIGSLCAFVADVICYRREGIFFPQNAEYVKTSEMARQIAAFHGRNMRIVPGGGWMKHLPFRTFRKAFGSLTYEKKDCIGRYGLAESVIRTEGWMVE